MSPLPVPLTINTEFVKFELNMFYKAQLITSFKIVVKMREEIHKYTLKLILGRYAEHILYIARPHYSARTGSMERTRSSLPRAVVNDPHYGRKPQM